MTKHIVSLIIGIIFLVVGSVLTFVSGMNYKHENITPDVKINYKEDTYEHNLTNKNYSINTFWYNEVKINYDNNLDNEMLIKVKYPEDLLSLLYEEKDDYIFIINDYNNRHFLEASKIFVEALKISIKNKRIYNYNPLTTATINIYINEKNINNIIINRIDYNDYYGYDYEFDYDDYDDDPFYDPEYLD